MSFKTREIAAIRIAASAVLSLTVLFICSRCGMFPTQTGNGVPVFSMQIQYSGQLCPGSTFPFFRKGDSGSVHGLAKSFSVHSIDAVRVMVLDFSKYKDLEEFWNSEEYSDFLIIAREWTGDIDEWAEWERIFSKAFSIASNQTISIEGDTARGIVPGVSGLNYFIVAMLEKGKIKYAGESHARAEEGKTRNVEVQMYEWLGEPDEYPYYYYEEPVDSIVVSPSEAVVQGGMVQQFTCRIYFSDGTMLDDSNDVIWANDPELAGTISADGLFQASTTTTGTEIITAVYYTTAGGNYTDTATVTVIPYIIGPYPP
ncbi:hypothetical protein JW948_07515 [bacterium]|nr:hypothetical protein [bacterium]